MTKKELYRVDLDYSFTWDRAVAWFFRRGANIRRFDLDAHRYNRIMECLRASTIDPEGYASVRRFGVVYNAY